MVKKSKPIEYSNDLSKCVNIGKDTEFKLKQVGIDSFEKLKSAGSEGAFISIQKLDSGACLSLLCGLEGAIDGIKWNELSAERKLELSQFLKMTKKK